MPKFLANLLVVVCLGVFVPALAQSPKPLFEIQNYSARFYREQNLSKFSVMAVNHSAEPLTIEIFYELDDENNHAQPVSTQLVELKPGPQKLFYEFDQDQLPAQGFKWKKPFLQEISYRVHLQNGNQFQGGSIELTRPDPEPFVISFISPDTACTGTDFHLPVKVLNPTTLAPIAGVRISGTIQYQDDTPDGSIERQLRQEAISDQNGLAMLTFRFEKSIDYDSQLDLEADDGLYQTETTLNISVETPAQFLLHTDKPLYQPGQTMHIRAQLFDLTNHALPNEKVTLIITNPKHEKVVEHPLTTSANGIIAFDWEIPAAAPLGDYKIQIKSEQLQIGDESLDFSWPTVKVSRYDLPKFTVETRLDRTFYLSGQDATVELKSIFLHGKPVSGGQYRISKINPVSSNYYGDVLTWPDNPIVAQGSLDANGTSPVRIDLSDLHFQFRDSRERFQDVEFLAEVTDSVSGENRSSKFVIRISHGPIHVYFIPQSLINHITLLNQPLQFYISTTTADGQPVACEVKISQLMYFKDGFTSSSWIDDAEFEIPLKTVHTNRFGVTRVTLSQVPHNLDPEQIKLKLIATDARHQTSVTTGFLTADTYPTIQLSPDKTIYRQDEPISLTVTSILPQAQVTVSLLCQNRILSTHQISLSAGKATFNLPFQPEFEGELMLVAFLSNQMLTGQSIRESDWITVVYPRPRLLNVKATAAQTTLRPGEQASVSMQITDEKGNPVEGTLGLAVTDRAVESAYVQQQVSYRQGWYGYTVGCYAYAPPPLILDSLGGYTQTDLLNLDPSQPIPEELQTVAEMLYRLSGSTHPLESNGPGLTQPDEKVRFYLSNFESLFSERDHPVPQTLEEVEQLFPLKNRLDPWENQYQIRVFPNAVGLPQIEFYSAGPDSKFSTQDDIVVRFPLGNPFRAVGVKINQAIQNYDQREHGFLATFAALKAELKTLGVDFDALRDQWGHPYRLEWHNLKAEYDDDACFSVVIKSGGPNGRFEPPDAPASDDFPVWAESIIRLDDFAGSIDDIARIYRHQHKHFPRNRAEWNQALQLPRRPKNLTDPWGRPFSPKFEIKTDRMFQIPHVQPGHSEYLASFHWPLIPAGTMSIRKAVVSFSSSGPDRRPGTADDFIALTYEEPILPIVKLHSTSNRQLSDHQPRKAGLMAGILTNEIGLVLAGADVELRRMDSRDKGIKAWADSEGKFQFVDLQPGLYSLNIQVDGYRSVSISSIPVIAGHLTPVCQKISLQPYDPSTASEVISVTAGETGPNLPRQKMPARSDTSQLLTTPRIRKDFPETLYWLPELVTDQQGRAQVQFPVADAMTTWKCAVIATTLDGRQAVTQTDLQVTQPFFVEADLPSRLTEGDLIHLPVVVRNYVSVPQTVTVELKLPPEVTLVGQPHQQLQLQATTSTRLFFQIRAEKPLTDGRIQIIARGSQFSDAVEQPFSIRPDGPEILQTVSRSFSGQTQVEVVIPASARKTQSTTELKLYPNAVSHVLTCLTGMLQQPYGCAEQTISTTIPNLLLLHYLKLNHIEHHPQKGVAMQNLQAGYQRLLQFQHSDGGFGYFSTSSRDMALTAYVVQFLQDAQPFVVVNRNVLHTAAHWLLRQQKADGSWAGSPQLTGYITRMLTQLPNTSDSVGQALHYLSTQVETTQEAYTLAQTALAAQATSNQPLAQKAISRLKALAIPTESAVFWNNPRETLFFGYGRTGRLETTALALEALGKTEASSELIGKGWLYLLENKDFYGGWYSTYATAQTLRALQTAFGSHQTTETRIKVLVNGEPVNEFDVSARDDQPIAINLAEKLTAEHNTIELQQIGGQLPLTMQITAPYFLSWASAKSALTQHSATCGKLTLKVGLSQANAPTSTPITCAVDIFRQFSPDAYHHGMYLAEIGLPPGAIVDRESLNRALQQSSGSISQYELQPGRVIFYLNSWNHQAHFTFSFSLKFPLAAQSMPSRVYDYYNPEEQVTVPPVMFSTL